MEIDIRPLEALKLKDKYSIKALRIELPEGATARNLFEGNANSQKGEFNAKQVFKVL